MVHLVVFYTYLVLTCGYALLRGGGPERAVAGCWLAAVAATVLVTVFDDRSHYRQIETEILVVDVLLFLALGAVALAANRFWTLWVSSMQLVAVAAHGAKAYQAQIAPWMYHAIVAWMAYPMLAVLVIGTVRHRQRLRRSGTDPAWRPFLRPSSTIPTT